MKIAVNRSHGRFMLSDKAAEWLKERNPSIALECNNDEFVPRDQWYLSNRSDPLLIECIETLGEEASGYGANLAAVVVPDSYTDSDWIEEEGYERIIYVVDGKIGWAMTEEEEKARQAYLASIEEVKE